VRPSRTLMASTLITRVLRITETGSESGEP